MMTTIQAKAVRDTLMGAFPELFVELHTPDGQAGDIQPAVIIHSPAKKMTKTEYTAIHAGNSARLLAKGE